MLAAAVAACGAAAGAPDDTVRAEGTGSWIAHDGAVQLRIGQDLAARRSMLRIIAASTDVTALASYPEPGLVQIRLPAAALPAGESELAVYVVEGAQWRELLRAPLKLLTRGGFEQASVTPKLDLATKSQLAYEAYGTTGAPARERYADLTARGSLAFAAARNGWAADGQFNGTGSSHRPESLRYGERGAAANKFDLSDYAVRLTHGASTLSVGHQSVGNNPLLLSGFSSRGLGLTQRVGERIELSLHALNATSIVGFDNFLGLETAEHRVVTGGVGLELLARPGALRAELMYMDASMLARGNFNAGEIVDAQTSHGFGLRLSGASQARRLRGELVVARSTYVNPADPLLAQGGPSQPVRPDTEHGFTVDLGADLLRDARLSPEGAPLTLTATLRHERVNPLFRSLGASLAAGQRSTRVGLGLQWAGAQLQLAHQQQRDNLDDLPTLLTTRTDTSSLNAQLPLAQWFGTPGRPGAWPALSVQWQEVHQFATNVPVTEDSGFAASHRPDQRNRQAQVALAWTLERISWNYGLNHSQQDNRQPGRERADFSSLAHQLNAAWRATGALNLTFGVQRNRNFSLEKELVARTHSAQVGLDWTWRERWTVAANASLTRGSDSQGLVSNTDRTLQAQLGYRFEVPAFRRMLPGQAFVRVSEHAARNRDSSFGLSTTGGHRALEAGLSLSLF
jgi:hypothetical protein